MRNKQNQRLVAPLETRVLQDDQLDAVAGGTPGSLAAAAGGPSAARGRRILDCEGSAYLTGELL
jgi:hypothetical protein